MNLITAIARIALVKSKKTPEKDHLRIVLNAEE